MMSGSNASMANMGVCKNDPLLLPMKSYLCHGRMAPAVAFGNVISGRPIPDIAPSKGKTLWSLP